MIIPMLCVTIFVILVVWFLLPRVARLMIHTPTAISIFVCLSMVQLMAVFISMRCTLCGHFLQRSEERRVGKEGRDLLWSDLLNKWFGDMEREGDANSAQRRIASGRGDMNVEGPPESPYLLGGSRRQR